ncbi:MAG: divergent PAP2 family protein [Candidatus Krumholzibacteriia bacterium]
MLELIRSQPFLVAITAGACAQFLKVLSFLMLEKRVNYKRFVQTDGAPNMHSAAFSALTAAVGMGEGVDSLAFAFAVCVTAIILVDTMNVKNATSRQKEAVLLLLDRLRKRPDPNPDQKRLSYTPLDVLSGMVMGVTLAFLI